jgi:hypothetical protein
MNMNSFACFRSGLVKLTETTLMSPPRGFQPANKIRTVRLPTTEATMNAMMLIVVAPICTGIYYLFRLTKRFAPVLYAFDVLAWYAF